MREQKPPIPSEEEFGRLKDQAAGRYLPADVLKQRESHVKWRRDFVRQVTVDCRFHQLVGKRNRIPVRN